MQKTHLHSNCNITDAEKETNIMLLISSKFKWKTKQQVKATAYAHQLVQNVFSSV